MKNFIHRPALPAIGSPRDCGKYVNLMSDVGFKLVFGNPRNKDLLIALLGVITPSLRIDDLTYPDKERTGFWKNSKKACFDVLCKTQGGEEIIIEVQVCPQKDFADRVLYYASYDILGQHKSGDTHYDLTPVHSISLLDFCLKEEHAGDAGMVEGSQIPHQRYGRPGTFDAGKSRKGFKAAGFGGRAPNIVR